MNTLTLTPVTQCSPRLATVGRVSPLMTINAILLLVAAVLLRVYRIDSVPGLNGDEAWSGVQAMRWLQGEPIAWRTPTGNPLNLFFFVPLALLHAVFSPSILLLRAVSLASGVAALAVNYLLCRRVFDPRTALVSTLILALLPINIAYSRFAWDASQSLLATLFVLYLPLCAARRRGHSAWPSGGAAIALAAAVWVHPTNVFAAPLIVAPALYFRRGDLLRTLRESRLPAHGWALVMLLAISLAVVYGTWRVMSYSAGRLHGLNELPAFLLGYLQLFSGTTIYRFIAGTDTAGSEAPAGYLLPTGDVLFMVVAAFALWGLWRRLQGQGADFDRVLALGWLLMLAGFFLVAGPRALAPHFERYAICLIAPGSLVLARGVSWWLEAERDQVRTARVAIALCGWLWPLAFGICYLGFIQQTGGRSHLAFRTAGVEPKLAALEQIKRNEQPGHAALVVTDGWWTYWPLAYLASDRSELQVVTWQDFRAPSGSPARHSRTAPTDDAWFVAFAGTPEELAIVDYLAKTGASASRYTLAGGGESVLLVLFHRKNTVGSKNIKVRDLTSDEVDLVFNPEERRASVADSTTPDEGVARE